MLSRVLSDDGKRNEDSIRAVAAAAMITTLQAMKTEAKYILAPDLNEWIGLSCILMCVWGRWLWYIYIDGPAMHIYILDQWRANLLLIISIIKNSLERYQCGAYIW